MTTRTHLITINSAQVGEDIADYPALLVRGSFLDEVFDPSNALTSAQIDGGDVWFSSDFAGLSRLSCQIISFEHDSTSGAADAVINIRVKVPSALDLTDVLIYVHYNSLTVDVQPLPGAAFGRNSVWAGNGFESVHHMTEAAGTIAIDSTGNGYDGTFGGTLPTAVAGQNQDGQSFNGTTDHISSIKSYGALFDGSNDYSIETYSEFSVNNIAQVLFYPRSDHDIQLLYRGDNGDGYRFSIWDGSSNLVQSGALVSAGVMRHIVATAAAAGNMELYVDNVSQGTPVPSAAPLALTDTDNNMIGAGSVTGFRPYNGILQSTIVHNVVRSVGYWLTAHNNVSNPSAFTTPSVIAGTGTGNGRRRFISNVGKLGIR